MQLDSIQLYPIKSLDGVEVDEAALGPGGGLARDREWGLLDARGGFVNGKSCVLVHALRADFDLASLTVRLSREGADAVGPLSLVRDVPALEAWFSDHLEQPVRLVRDERTGFPDDRDRPGPTIAAAASLEAVESWFGWSAGEARRRFRVNLLVGGAPAFWEDRLVAADGRPVPLRIGSAEIHGANACQRCVVPSRDPLTGVAIRRFQVEFRERREADLPAWAARERFEGQFYRLAVNTLVPEGSRGRVLRAGDAVG